MIGGIFMTTSMKGRIGKRGPVYLPKSIRKQLNLNEGDQVKFELKEGKLIMIPTPDPVDLALNGEK